MLKNEDLLVDPIIEHNRQPGPMTDLTIPEIEKLLTDNDYGVHRNSIRFEELEAGMGNDPETVIHCALALMPADGSANEAEREAASRHPESWRHVERMIAERALHRLPDNVLAQLADRARPDRKPPQFPFDTRRIESVLVSSPFAVDVSPRSWDELVEVQTAAKRRGDSLTVALCAIAQMPRLYTNAVQMRGRAQAREPDDSRHPAAWYALGKTT